jgi:hypothetical protein
VEAREVDGGQVTLGPVDSGQGVRLWAFCLLGPGEQKLLWDGVRKVDSFGYGMRTLYRERTCL